MPRVVPSQVVSFLDHAYGPDPMSPNSNGLDWSHGPTIEAICNLVDQIPAELLSLDAEDYATLSACNAAMKFHLSRWKNSGNAGLLHSIRGHPGQHVITLLRAVLEKCPDEAPSPGTIGLEFLDDADFREKLRTDISAAYSAERNGEWKSATVLAGSVIEALLLWKLMQEPPDTVTDAATGAAAAGFAINPALSLERWDLAHYLEVCRRLEFLTVNTISQASLAKNFRNLIHPGRAIRLGQECNRATALSALAAVEHVVNDIS